MDQQGGVSFQTTPMGKITHTHSPRTGVESSTTYLRVRIYVYSPRTGIRSKCLQNPWGVTLTMEPNHLRRLQDAVGFFFFTTTNRQIPTGTITVGFSFFTMTRGAKIIFPSFLKKTKINAFDANMLKCTIRTKKKR